MAQHVKVNPTTDEMLSKLSEKRKRENSFIRTKQDIAAEAIVALYKKEMKNG
ncbi:hypothetical protein PODOV050v2_p0023 [Vibrio phage 66E30.1]|nr:hypothetical protein PODOV001v2_p0021 [Vibrio phage 41E34.2]QZI91252.1 hypothetical protein PODOV053v2_p0024 [Vibrio phage 24E30.2]QZI91291.1 hypothetical protein PODOV052v2_p0023 [Vibrio phage 24E35.2]QZI91452.1 hypothetical protein PODOV048v2_p0021 [Vibrio phage 34E29.1]QZI91489.1 hypothetical protein PODOV007v2_p0021 [Vibrio phage 36E38.1]QZI91758.1 hypothetical protein PODOV008v2_p0021 [Vibrio phage 44E38.1]QZI91795.1 hypothetical protein PODOV046v2_p0021 [Vibrio phage 44E38.2]QZI9198